MQDQRVTEILRELPREQARPGFTTRVLARLDEPRPRWRWQPRLARLAAAAFAAVLVVTLGVAWQEQREQARVAEARRLVRELRAEHSQLEQELQEIAEPPVIYLGGDEEVDLVVDMGRVPEADGIEPATLRYDTF